MSVYYTTDDGNMRFVIKDVTDVSNEACIISAPNQCVLAILELLSITLIN